MSITELEPYELLGLYESDKQNANKEKARKEILRRLNLYTPESHRDCNIKLNRLEPVKLGPDKTSSTLSTAKYTLSHNTHGAQGTTYEFDVTMEYDTADYAEKFPSGQPQEIKRVKATVDLGTVEAHTVEDCFNKLSEWCLRAAKALHNRKTPKLSLPVW